MFCHYSLAVNRKACVAEPRFGCVVYPGCSYTGLSQGLMEISLQPRRGQKKQQTAAKCKLFCVNTALKNKGKFANIISAAGSQNNLPSIAHI